MSVLLIQFGWLWAVIAICFVITVSYCLYKAWWFGAAICAVIAVVFVACWWYSSTHAIIPIDQKGVVINADQTFNGSMRPSGIVDIPLWGATVYNYTAQTAYRPCDNKENPAISGGVAVFVNVCYLSNASEINWQAQIVRQGTTDSGKMWEAWHFQRSQAIAQAMGTVTKEDLTSNTTKVGQLIFDKIAAIFEAEGIPLTAVVVPWWDYQNQSAGQILDNETTAGQAAIMRANLAATEAAIKADTAAATLKKQTDAINKALDQLQITNPQDRAMVLETWLLLDRQNVTIIIGSSNQPIIVQPKTPIATPPATPDASKQ